MNHKNEFASSFPLSLMYVFNLKIDHVHFTRAISYHKLYTVYYDFIQHKVEQGPTNQFSRDKGRLSTNNTYLPIYFNEICNFTLL